MNQWSSRLSFVLATAGAAVGLGNIWRFPAMVHTHGGGLFIVLYLICILFIGIPMMTAELMLGQLSHKNSIDGIEDLSHRENASQYWKWISVLGLITMIMILSFYSVISGFTMMYLMHAVSGKLSHAVSPMDMKNIWLASNTLNNKLILHTAFILITILVVNRGINKGIERASNIMMPLLFFALILLVIGIGLNQGLGTSWSVLTSTPKNATVFGVLPWALGQAFFSLAVGAGCLFVYGAYLPRSISLPRAVSIIVFLDVLVALLSSTTVFSTVNQNMVSSDFSLIFETIPLAFNQFPGGYFFSIGFMILLFFAAWTSSISMLEPSVCALEQKTRLSRPQAGFFIGFITWVLGAMCCYSGTFLEHIITISNNIMLPIGAFGFMIFAGWIVSKSNSQPLLGRSFKVWSFLTRWLAPTSVLLILFHMIQGNN